MLEGFSSSTDLAPPKIVIEQLASGAVTNTNIIVSGRVLDDLSGVQTLEVQRDGGVFAAVSFNASGQFSLATGFALDGSGEGQHVFGLRATDAKGNASPIVSLTVTLDTRAPSIAVLAPLADGLVQAGDLLEGSASGTGSNLTQLTYAIDGASLIPVPFTSDGGFAVPLDLSRLAAGSHTLRVQASDGAGNLSTVSEPFELDSAIPLALVDSTPSDGAVDVGATFRPKITFSRPIDRATLTSANFYAMGPTGAKIPAKIVVSSDATFAWLFFNDPLPGGSRIKMHIDGSTILAAANSQPLDANGDGLPGGVGEITFTTVSLTSLVGTTLSGRVFDPGPDLKPMTFDDLRAGADGACSRPTMCFCCRSLTPRSTSSGSKIKRCTQTNTVISASRLRRRETSSWRLTGGRQRVRRQACTSRKW